MHTTPLTQSNEDITNINVVGAFLYWRVSKLVLGGCIDAACDLHHMDANPNKMGRISWSYFGFCTSPPNPFRYNIPWG
jgi:hypothetical protein